MPRNESLTGPCHWRGVSAYIIVIGHDSRSIYIHPVSRDW